MKNNYGLRNLGFTLIELIIVMAIMAVLASAGLGNYFTSLKKGRDAKRKADLGNVQKALELYYNDYGRYPVASAGELGCCTWGEEFVDSKGTVYMQQLPLDPKSPSYYYYYIIDSGGKGTYFKLYACLENDQDPQRIVPNETVDCGGCEGSCNYGISSPNTNP